MTEKHQERADRKNEKTSKHHGGISTAPSGMLARAHSHMAYRAPIAWRAWRYVATMAVPTLTRTD